MGKGAFQELDQIAAVRQYVKYAGQAKSLEDIPRVVAEAFQVLLFLIALASCLASGPAVYSSILDRPFRPELIRLRPQHPFLPCLNYRPRWRGARGLPMWTYPRTF